MGLFDNIKINNYFNKLKKGKITIRDIPNEYLTSDMCFYEIKRNIKYFINMDKSLINATICNYVFENNIEFIKYISEEFITEEMVDKVIDYSIYKNCDLVKYIPKKYIDTNRYIKIIENISNFMSFIKIDDIPNEIRSNYISKAIKVDPYNILNYDVSSNDWINAIVLNEDLLKYLPDKYKSHDFYKELIIRKPEYVLSIDYKSQELYNIAFNIKPELINYFDKKYITEDMIKYVKTNNINYSLPLEYLDNYSLIEEFENLKNSLKGIIKVNSKEEKEEYQFIDSSPLEKSKGIESLVNRINTSSNELLSKNMDFLIELIKDCGNKNNISYNNIIDIFNKLIQTINITDIRSINQEQIDNIYSLSRLLSDELLLFINKVNELGIQYNYSIKNNIKEWDNSYIVELSIPNTLKVMEESINNYSSKINKNQINSKTM